MRYSAELVAAVASYAMFAKYRAGAIIVHGVSRMNDAFQMRWFDNTIRYLAGPVQAK